MQVPDAVYYMMRNTTLVSCNLSSNVITKIPPKFPAKFSLITGKKIYLNIVSTIKLNMIRVERNDFIDIALEYIYIPYTYFLYCVWFFYKQKCVFNLLVKSGRIALLERMNSLFVLSSSESLVMQMFVVVWRDFPCVVVPLLWRKYNNKMTKI